MKLSFIANHSFCLLLIGLFWLLPASTIFSQDVELVVLGTVQDAGAPQIACLKHCCSNLQNNPDSTLKVVSLGVIDRLNRKSYLFEATPDFSAQIFLLNRISHFGNTVFLPDGIFLTHAHIGHYTGLMFLGKEALNASKTPVFAMPNMARFLTQNGPWSQLISNENILLKSLENNQQQRLTSHLVVLPIVVPHRDEFSETVGYKIIGPNKKVLFIPDIDKWAKWDLSIIELIKEVDYAFLDATFYDTAEINNRDIAEIPHPFIIESMALFKNLTASDKAKVFFIHMNHTNPALQPSSSASLEIKQQGFNVARFMQRFSL